MSSYYHLKALEFKLNMNVLAVSSETGENIEELFFLIAKQMVQHKKQKDKLTKQRRHKKKDKEKK